MPRFHRCLSPFLLAAFLLIAHAVCGGSHRITHERLLRQFLANTSRYVRTHPFSVLFRLASALGSHPLLFCAHCRSYDVPNSPLAEITSSPFFQELHNQQKGQLLLQLGQMHLYGSSDSAVGLPLVAHPNITKATQFLQPSADHFGTPRAQFLLAALSTLDTSSATNGEGDVAQSVLLHHFGARGGSIASSMALGYRHLHGLGVPKSCETALRHYKFAADRVISVHTQTHHPIQLFMIPKPFRLSDNERRKPPLEREDAHRMEYLRQRARRSSDPIVLENAASVVFFSDFPDEVDSAAQQQQRNLEAKAFLERAIRLGSFSAKALLGHIYAYGLGGVHQDVPEAIRLYQEALNESAIANKTSAEAANGLGLIYFNGVGDIDIDYERAMRLFQVSARVGHADGVYNTGVLLSNSHPQLSQEYLEASAHVGHLQAKFKLARLKERAARLHGSSLQNNGFAASCGEVTKLYKQVAEHSEEGAELLASAAAAFLAGNHDHALVLYQIAAEMGYEVAESNAAWIMERAAPSWYSQEKGSCAHNLVYKKLVLRGVGQESPDAHVRYGDLLYVDGKYAMAMLHYEQADYLSSGKHGRALFSIGYMHAHGLGVSARSLEKAGLYYELVRIIEPALKDVLWLLQWKLQWQVRLETLYERFCSVSETLIQRVFGRMKRSLETNGSTPNHRVDRKERVDAALTSRSTVDSAIMHEPVSFASALRFTPASKLQLEVAHPPQSFTVETWINILQEETETQSRSRLGTRMVLLDLQDTYQLELIRGRVGDNWVLRFRTASTLIVFPHASFNEDEWYHVAVAVDGDHPECRVTLYVNGHVADQVEFRSPGENHDHADSVVRILSIGSSLARSMTFSAHQEASTNFIGELMHFRIWRTSTPPAPSVRTLMHSQPHESHMLKADLYVHLRVDIQEQREHESKKSAKGIPSGRTTSSLALNANHPVRRSEHVNPTMVRFPPEGTKKSEP